MESKDIDEQAAQAALEEISTLCMLEYGLTLEDVLTQPGAQQRLQRLTGVLLKRHFATRENRGADYNPTGANSSWVWRPEKLADPKLQKLDEYRLLDDIRREHGDGTWNSLVEVEHEAGLFYVFGRWVYGKLKHDERTLLDHYREPRSPEINLAINVVNLLPIAGVFAGIVSAPVIAVSLAFIATEYGLDKLSQPDAIPEP
jgi:hypothetical protein